jgi:hypothetical protein
MPRGGAVSLFVYAMTGLNHENGVSSQLVGCDCGLDLCAVFDAIRRGSVFGIQ